jgi:hypothetical protein
MIGLWNGQIALAGLAAILVIAALIASLSKGIRTMRPLT